MCIRDSGKAERFDTDLVKLPVAALLRALVAEHRAAVVEACLLYTSDAADERSSVDLGGRRIIKKKKDSDYIRC